MKSKRMIGSHEVRQWHFCPKQWYMLRTMGSKVTTPASKRGIAYHKQEARKISAVKQAQTGLITAMVIGGIACLIWSLS